MAAALACGADAAVNHRCAASLWGLLPHQAGAEVDVSVFGNGGRRARAGIRVHRSLSLRPESVTRRYGIPTTTPARTIIDLRRIISPPEHRRAVRQAEILGLRIGSDASQDRTRSELEFHFLALCHKNGLPAPGVNTRIGSLLVDFAWRDQRLIVETDGYRYHRGRAAFGNDRARDLELRSLGYEVIRLTYRQVVDNPEDISAVLKQALASRPTQAAREDPAS
jgi:hypothetical protein